METVEAVRADRIWPLVRSLRLVDTDSTASYYGLYGLYGQLCGLYGLHSQLLRLIKAGLDRGGFIRSRHQPGPAGSYGEQESYAITKMTTRCAMYECRESFCMCIENLRCLAIAVHEIIVIGVLVGGCEI